MLSLRIRQLFILCSLCVISEMTQAQAGLFSHYSFDDCTFRDVNAGLTEVPLGPMSAIAEQWLMHFLLMVSCNRPFLIRR